MLIISDIRSQAICCESRGLKHRARADDECSRCLIRTNNARTTVPEGVFGLPMSYDNYQSAIGSKRSLYYTVWHLHITI